VVTGAATKDSALDVTITAASCGMRRVSSMFSIED
jgi:hypothetical protein